MKNSVILLFSLFFSLSSYAMQLVEINDFQTRAFNYLGATITNFCKDYPDDQRALFFTRWIALSIKRNDLYRMEPGNFTIKDTFPEAMRDTPFSEDELSYIETGLFENKPVTSFQEWNTTFANKKKEIKQYYRCKKR